MKQGNFFRFVGLFGAAVAGAALALVGAALSGLGGSTTVEQFVAAGAAAAAKNPPARREAGRLSIEQIYRLDAPGVVEISAVHAVSRLRAAASQPARPLGSGFVIDKAGHILTNSSVVAGRRSVQVSFSGNDWMHARVIGVDAATGVAVLQVDTHSRALTPLPLGDSDDVQVGDLVVAIGNPPSFNRTATAGIVSAIRPTVDPSAGSAVAEHTIETDAAIDVASSGGPLIDSRGRVIGVEAPVPPSTRANGTSVRFAFAIPIDTAKVAVAQLIRHGKVEHAFLGVSAVPLTAAVARTFNLPSSRGLLVQAVVAGSGASKAGLRAGSTSVVVAGESYRLGGDIIIAADGVPVATEAQLGDVVAALAPGDQIRLEVWRSGAQQSVLVVLGQPPRG